MNSGIHWGRVSNSESTVNPSVSKKSIFYTLYPSTSLFFFFGGGGGGVRIVVPT